MSRKTEEGKRAKDAEERIAIRKRRWLLSLHILFLAFVIVGSRGPWFTAVHGERELWTVSGPDFAARFEDDTTPKPMDGVEGVRTLGAAKEAVEPEEPGMLATPGFLANLAMFAAILAFFFASFNLVSDADLQVPVLLSSLVVCLAAGLAFYAIYAPQRTLGEIIEQVETPTGMTPGEEIAPVTSSEADRPDSLMKNLPKLRFDWGASLMFAASPLLVILSAYLTFFAARTPERP